MVGNTADSRLIAGNPVALLGAQITNQIKFNLAHPRLSLGRIAEVTDQSWDADHHHPRSATLVFVICCYQQLLINPDTRKQAC